MFQISKETLARLRETYKPGTLVELVSMNDPYPGKLQPGCRGRVTAVDDIGTVFVNWRCGSSLGIAFSEDHAVILDDVVTVCYGERKEWDTRDEALRFFKEGMACSEGSERERYTNIVLALEAGEKEALDYDD